MLCKLTVNCGVVSREKRKGKKKNVIKKAWKEEVAKITGNWKPEAR